MLARMGRTASARWSSGSNHTARFGKSGRYVGYLGNIRVFRARLGRKRFQKCPNSLSPHTLRSGYLNSALSAGQPVDVAAERTNVSQEVLEKLRRTDSQREARESSEVPERDIESFLTRIPSISTEHCINHILTDTGNRNYV